jgi:hypothetical protein
MALSNSPILLILSTTFATIFIASGINAFVRPQHALSFFELPYPTNSMTNSSTNRDLVDALLAIYGVRDIFMGLAMYATAYYQHKKSLGWIMIAGSAVAFVDGWVCQTYAGKGEWGHWGYAPMLTIVGSLLLGVMNRHF